LVLFLVMCGTAAWAAGPLLNGRINDHAGVLSSSQRHLLHQLLSQHEAATRQHVALLTVATAGEEAVESHALRIWHAWESPKKGRTVLLVLFREQGGAAIVAGEELGAVLDAATIKRLLAGEIDAALSRGDFDLAALEGVKAIVGELNP
jgi:uncharacterized membrane protein YgcG